MNKYISMTVLLTLIIGCSGTTNVPKNVKLQSWQDSVSYSLGSDVGATLKARRMNFEAKSLSEGFIETYAKDSSYVLGASIGISYQSQMIDVDPMIFLNALKKTHAGDSTLITIEDMKNIVRKYDKELRESKVLEEKQKAEFNRIEGERFRDEYKNNSNSVIELESGLMYNVLNEGFGDIPTDKDRVVVHYTGKLINGTVFDSSVDRGEPSEFMVGAVIKGWQEALQLMNVGSKWELVIPSSLAYGDRGTGNIPANSTLIFEVELLGIE
jgi:FKBP-type peptidyl-prolyl cis-trans isomerase